MKLPAVSGRKIIKTLTKIGFEVVGRKGSHVRLKKKNDRTLIVVVPDHLELAKSTSNPF
ncbi:MAG: type II toxin-antitoxin system HicA family toxin [Candidatus Jordarchaeum sp.]|uniref:type II toxin-antitoxin system HicA family toxin n=1 Tax=Candidatus Jordarchaeum sp. TaxID=2823881 RepID=UPI00404BA011